MLVMDAIAQCVPADLREEMSWIVRVESSGNPWAVAPITKGVKLDRQPRNEVEAYGLQAFLEQRGTRYSAGAAQVNRLNFRNTGLDRGNTFDTCANVAAGARILSDCKERAQQVAGANADSNTIRQMGWSCYYSGNFKTGFIREANQAKSYVEKVLSVSKFNTPVIAYSFKTAPQKLVFGLAARYARYIGRNEMDIDTNDTAPLGGDESEE